MVPPEIVPYCRRTPSDPRSELMTDCRFHERIDKAQFPDFHAKAAERIVVVEQEEGDIIFVPSDWHHLVENISPFVISINHNWCNSTNLTSLHASMWEEVEATESELQDVFETLVEARQRRQSSPKDCLQGVRREEDSIQHNEVIREWCDIVQNVVKDNAGWE